MKKFSKLNESNEYDNFLNLPPVESLGDGVYEGALWGHCFSHNGNKFYCSSGTRNKYPYKVRVIIENGECKPFDFIDNFQHPNLRDLFNDLNESVKQQELPTVESLGDGEYEGALWGSVFAHNGKKYLCKEGLLNIFPNMVKIIVKDGNVVLPYTSIDETQRPELKNLFD